MTAEIQADTFTKTLVARTDIYLLCIHAKWNMTLLPDRLVVQVDGASPLQPVCRRQSNWWEPYFFQLKLLHSSYMPAAGDSERASPWYILAVPHRAIFVAW